MLGYAYLRSSCLPQLPGPCDERVYPTERERASLGGPLLVEETLAAPVETVGDLAQDPVDLPRRNPKRLGWYD